jgi:hypothetical protein
MEGRRVSEGKYMMGEESYRRGLIMRIGGRKNDWRGEDCSSGFGFSGFVVGFWSFGEPSQGAPGCWGFWARGPGFLTVSWS